MDFTKARDSEWQWCQLGHMQVCILLQTDNHASTAPLSFFNRLDALPAAQPTASKSFQIREKMLKFLMHTVCTSYWYLTLGITPTIWASALLPSHHAGLRQMSRLLFWGYLCLGANVWTRITPVLLDWLSRLFVFFAATEFCGFFSIEIYREKSNLRPVNDWNVGWYRLKISTLCRSLSDKLICCFLFPIVWVYHICMFCLCADLDINEFLVLFWLK